MATGRGEDHNPWTIQGHEAQGRPGNGPLIAALVASFLAWFPTTAIAIALPTMHAELGTSIAGLAWIPNAYLLSLAATVLLVGRVTDRVGHRRMLIIGLVAFATAAMATAVAPGLIIMLIAIAGLGLAGAMLITSSLALIGSSYQGRRRIRALSLWAAASAMAQALGVPIGGLLTQSTLGWRSIFWICAPLAIAAALLSWRFAVESGVDSSLQLDILGALTLGMALVAATVLFMQGATWGWLSPATILTSLVMVVLFAVGLTAMHRAPDPIIPMNLATNQRFVGGQLINASFNACLMGVLFLMPLFIQDALDHTPGQTGVLLLALTGTIVIFSPVGSTLSNRFGERIPLVIAMSLTAVGNQTIPAIRDRSPRKDRRKKRGRR